MREVQPGDLVFHFIDKNAIVGISVISKAFDDSVVSPRGTKWEGRPAYLLRLEKHTKLSSPIGRSEFLESPKYHSELEEIARTHDSLFFDYRLKLRQGAYLTIAPPQLVRIWDEIYLSKTGSHLPLLDVNSFSNATKGEEPRMALAEPTQLGNWIFQGNPEHFNIDAHLKNRTEVVWTVRQSKNQIAEGDRVLFWRSGADGGVVADGIVISKPSEGISDDAPELWTSGKGQQAGEVRCKLHVLNEFVDSPISRERIRNALPDLGILKFPNATNFRIEEHEYAKILSLRGSEGSMDSGANQATEASTHVEIEPYDKNKAMDGLFLSATQFDEMLDALEEKKNVVLQGAPGVGKTFVAKRLAYALIGSNDRRRVETIQFHQSYSYEDFIQGFRPTPKGHFDLKFGIFYEFCRRAQRDESAKKPYVFIIDEINRGNLSKIFGELMMLIEPDKRGKEFAIPLAYSQSADEKFYIPENLHLIGMMNTADRSLAMVDYALRRRFRFITLKPEFASDQFRKFLGGAGAAPELVKKIVGRMNALNEIIAADAKNLGPGYQIGHSYFCPRNGIKPDDDWYRRVIESEIAPLIQEYWFDNEQKVKEQCAALLA
jgi:hypothetical protein